MSRLQRHPVVKAARERGWLARHSKGGHIQLAHPEIPGEKITIASTPSDYRATHNEIARVRRFERMHGIAESDRRSRRVFGPIRAGRDAHNRMTARLTCGRCGAIEDYVARIPGAAIPKAHDIAKRFEKLGWSVGPARAKDLCPACVETKAFGQGSPEKDTPLPPLTMDGAPSALNGAAVELATQSPASQAAIKTKTDDDCVLVDLQGRTGDLVDELVAFGAYGATRESVVTTLFLERLRMLHFDGTADAIRGQKKETGS